MSGEMTSVSLSRPAGARRADRRAQHDARALGDRDRRARGGGELHARADQRADVGADQRRRHQPEVRQRRVAPADVGRVDEHAAVVLLLGELAEARRRIGDGDEVRARARDVAAAARQRLLPEVPLERLDLDGAARLRGDDEQRLPVPRSGASTAATAAGSVLSRTCSAGPPAAAPDHADHLGPQRAAAHPQQHDVRVAGRLHVGGERLQLGAACVCISAGARSQPRRLLIDRSCDGSLEKNVASRLPDARQRAVLRQLARRRRRWRCCSASGSDSLLAARRRLEQRGAPPADGVEQRLHRRDERLHAVVEQAVADARQVEAHAPRTPRPRFLAPVEVVLDARRAACRDRGRRPASRAAPC